MMDIHNNSKVSKPTRVNFDLNWNGDSADRATRVNSQNGGHTVVNTGKAVTVVNVNSRGQTSVNIGDIHDGDIFELEPGVILDGGYIIECRQCAADESGEADIYRCQKETKRYIAKVFRRKYDRDDRLLHTLQDLHHPNIAHIYHAGQIFGREFHVFEYYPVGSVSRAIESGKRFDLEELKTIFIPCLNDALHTLHGIGILHRDIKPSNIMITQDNKPVLIDFGISSVTNNGRVTKVTKAAFTSGYQAPEVASNIYKDISDYYSLGVVLYEMFTGSMPDWDSIVIEKPDDMPNRLYGLIRGLTYADWKRYDEGPDHRWSYDEVKNWLDGKLQPVPGMRDAEEYGRSLRPVLFNGQRYDNIDKLCEDMAINWNLGKTFVFRGTMRTLLSLNQTNGNCRDWIALIDDMSSAAVNQQDEAYTELLYKISPALENRVICELGKPMNLESFGQAIIYAYTSGESDSVQSIMKRLCHNGRLFKIAAACRREDAERISALEKKLIAVKSADARRCLTCEIGYVLSGDRTLHLTGCGNYDTVNELRKVLKEKGREGGKALLDYCKCLLIDEHRMQPMLYGWLASKGAITDASKWLV